MERVYVYIDGFNLYFGLRQNGWKRLYWLNLQALARSLLRTNQRLVHTKYFTSLINHPPDKRIRQQTFLEALGTLSDFTVYYGHYLLTDRVCPRCGYQYRVPNEKMTDVSIAVEILADAIADRYDTALLISGDSDLRSPIERVRSLYPEKRIVVAFPPNRHSMALANSANAYFTIGRAKLRQSVFPDVVVRADGYQLNRPKEWC